jgi:site-specific recombinase XerD
VTAPQPAVVLLADTIDAYLAQIAVSLRPGSVRSARTILRRFAGFLADAHPEVIGAADITRAHIESYKMWLANQPGRRGGTAATETIRHRLSTLRMFFERIIEWGWDDAPARVPIFAGDVPKRDERLPKFLDDATFARFMQAARAEPRPLARLVIELLARTGMRVGELCALESDAVVLIGTSHWLRIPLGKLHNERMIPLHPQLVDMIDHWLQGHNDHGTGLLLVNENNRRPLNRHIVTRMINRVTNAAGIGHVHPHQLRHTLATQAINRGMSIEAIAALLGHRSLDMTMTYARMADRTVADEYFAVSARVEALYDQPRRLPAEAEGPAMARLRREHSRMLGNGYCNRPIELDCAFETICEGCSYYATTIAFRPTLRRQRDDARKKNQTGREALFNELLDRLDNKKPPSTP